MRNKARLIKDCVLMRFSFGRSKAGNEFKDERELFNYTCEEELVLEQSSTHQRVNIINVQR